MTYPASLPATHRALLDTIVSTLSQDPRKVAIGASGSYASNTMDQYSDLDLVIAIEPNDYDQVMCQRFQLVEDITGFIAGFTGEHVGEPRLIIALYEPDLVHVDFKFVSLEDAAQRVDDTQIVWQRDPRLAEIYKNSDYTYPAPTIQWVEDRFWIWIHYGTGKIARGEYFEAMEFLSFLRTTVLSPLALSQNNMTPSGVRSIETRLPVFAKKLADTIATPEKTSLVSAYRHCIALYLSLRDTMVVNKNPSAQTRALDFFQHIDTK